MKRIALLLICWCLMAATCDTKPTQPVDCHADPLCFAPCPPLTYWDGDRDGPRLDALMKAHDAENAECDKRRAFCEACIQTARKAGAIQ